MTAPQTTAPLFEMQSDEEIADAGGDEVVPLGEQVADADVPILWDLSLVVTESSGVVVKPGTGHAVISSTASRDVAHIPRPSRLPRIRRELEEAVKDASEADWDSYGALPVRDEAVEQAKRFLSHAPPDLPEPAITATPNGTIAFEWAGDRNVFTILASGGDDMHWSALLIGDELRGTTHLQEDAFPSIVLRLIRDAVSE